MLIIIIVMKLKNIKKKNQRERESGECFVFFGWEKRDSTTTWNLVSSQVMLDLLPSLG